MFPSHPITYLTLSLFIPYTCVFTGKFSEFSIAELSHEGKEEKRKEDTV